VKGVHGPLRSHGIARGSPEMTIHRIVGSSIKERAAHAVAGKGVVPIGDQHMPAKA
jgi:hypothetical protein